MSWEPILVQRYLACLYRLQCKLRIRFLPFYSLSCASFSIVTGEVKMNVQKKYIDQLPL